MATPGDSRQPEVPVNDADDHSGRLGSGVRCRLFPGVGAEDGDVNRLVTPEVPFAVQEGSRPVSRCQTMSTGRLKLRGKQQGTRKRNVDAELVYYYYLRPLISKQ
ncbi:hypothetical protein quinque_007649 [Culex quinquefasciatus]